MRFRQIMMAAAGGGGFSYDADAALYFAAVVTAGGTVSDARKRLLNTLIVQEKSAGTWALTDDYWMLAAESATQGLVSLKQRRTATVVSAPSFVADRGYTTNGTSSYVNTGFVPNTNKVAMSTTSMRVAVYQRTNVSSAGVAVGSNDATTTNALWIIPRNTSDQMSGRCMSATATFAGIIDSRGFSAISTPNGTTISSYKNGAFVSNSSVSGGAALPSVAAFIGARNNNGSATSFLAAEFAFACEGAQLTAAQELAQYTNVQAHMTAIGANV
jgi:hypothetical protein